MFASSAFHSTKRGQERHRYPSPSQSSMSRQHNEEHRLLVKATQIIPRTPLPNVMRILDVKSKKTSGGQIANLEKALCFPLHHSCLGSKTTFTRPSTQTPQCSALWSAFEFGLLLRGFEKLGTPRDYLSPSEKDSGKNDTRLSWLLWESIHKQHYEAEVARAKEEKRKKPTIEDRPYVGSLFRFDSNGFYSPSLADYISRLLAVPDLEPPNSEVLFTHRTKNLPTYKVVNPRPVVGGEGQGIGEVRPHPPPQEDASQTNQVLGDRETDMEGEEEDSNNGGIANNGRDNDGIQFINNNHQGYLNHQSDSDSNDDDDEDDDDDIMTDDTTDTKFDVHLVRVPSKNTPQANSLILILIPRDPHFDPIQMIHHIRQAYDYQSEQKKKQQGGGNGGGGRRSNTSSINDTSLAGKHYGSDRPFTDKETIPINKASFFNENIFDAGASKDINGIKHESITDSTKNCIEFLIDYFELVELASHHYLVKSGAYKEHQVPDKNIGRLGKCFGSWLKLLHGQVEQMENKPSQNQAIIDFDCPLNPYRLFTINNAINILGQFEEPDPTVRTTLAGWFQIYNPTFDTVTDKEKLFSRLMEKRANGSIYFHQLVESVQRMVSSIQDGGVHNEETAISIYNYPNPQSTYWFAQAGAKIVGLYNQNFPWIETIYQVPQAVLRYKKKLQQQQSSTITTPSSSSSSSSSQSRNIDLYQAMRLYTSKIGDQDNSNHEVDSNDHFMYNYYPTSKKKKPLIIDPESTWDGMKFNPLNHTKSFIVSCQLPVIHNLIALHDACLQMRYNKMVELKPADTDLLLSRRPHQETIVKGFLKSQSQSRSQSQTPKPIVVPYANVLLDSLSPIHAEWLPNDPTFKTNLKILSSQTNKQLVPLNEYSYLQRQYSWECTQYFDTMFLNKDSLDRIGLYRDKSFRIMADYFIKGTIEQPHLLTPSSYSTFNLGYHSTLPHEDLLGVHIETLVRQFMSICGVEGEVKFKVIMTAIGGIVLGHMDLLHPMMTHIFLAGPKAAGKSFTIEILQAILLDDIVRVFAASTDNAFLITGDYSGFVIMSEESINELFDGKRVFGNGTNLLKTLMSDGNLIKNTCAYVGSESGKSRTGERHIAFHRVCTVFAFNEFFSAMNQPIKSRGICLTYNDPFMIAVERAKTYLQQQRNKKGKGGLKKTKKRTLLGRDGDRDGGGNTSMDPNQQYDQEVKSLSDQLQNQLRLSHPESQPGPPGQPDPEAVVIEEVDEEEDEDEEEYDDEDGDEEERNVFANGLFGRDNSHPVDDPNDVVHGASNTRWLRTIPLFSTIGGCQPSEGDEGDLVSIEALSDFFKNHNFNQVSTSTGGTKNKNTTTSSFTPNIITTEMNFYNQLCQNPTQLPPQSIVLQLLSPSPPTDNRWNQLDNNDDDDETSVFKLPKDGTNPFYTLRMTEAGQKLINYLRLENSLATLVHYALLEKRLSLSSHCLWLMLPHLINQLKKHYPGIQYDRRIIVKIFLQAYNYTIERAIREGFMSPFDCWTGQVNEKYNVPFQQHFILDLAPRLFIDVSTTILAFTTISEEFINSWQHGFYEVFVNQISKLGPFFRGLLLYEREANSHGAPNFKIFGMQTLKVQNNSRQQQQQPAPAPSTNNNDNGHPPVPNMGLPPAPLPASASGLPPWSAMLGNPNPAPAPAPAPAPVRAQQQQAPPPPPPPTTQQHVMKIPAHFFSGDADRDTLFCHARFHFYWDSAKNCRFYDLNYIILFEENCTKKNLRQSELIDKLIKYIRDLDSPQIGTFEPGIRGTIERLFGENINIDFKFNRVSNDDIEAATKESFLYEKLGKQQIPYLPVVVTPMKGETVKTLLYLDRVMTSDNGSPQYQQQILLSTHCLLKIQHENLFTKVTKDCINSMSSYESIFSLGMLQQVYQDGSITDDANEAIKNQLEKCHAGFSTETFQTNNQRCKKKIRVDNSANSLHNQTRDFATREFWKGYATDLEKLSTRLRTVQLEERIRRDNGEEMEGEREVEGDRDSGGQYNILEAFKKVHFNDAHSLQVEKQMFEHFTGRIRNELPANTINIDMDVNLWAACMHLTTQHLNPLKVDAKTGQLLYLHQKTPVGRGDEQRANNYIMAKGKDWRPIKSLVPSQIAARLYKIKWHINRKNSLGLDTTSIQEIEIWRQQILALLSKKIIAPPPHVLKNENTSFYSKALRSYIPKYILETLYTYQRGGTGTGGGGNKQTVVAPVAPVAPIVIPSSPRQQQDDDEELEEEPEENILHRRSKRQKKSPSPPPPQSPLNGEEEVDDGEVDHQFQYNDYHNKDDDDMAIDTDNVPHSRTRSRSRSHSHSHSQSQQPSSLIL